MKLGSPKHRNPFKCLSSVWGGLGRKGAQDERKEEQSEYSVPMAFSQGAGPHIHSASHPVGRSQVRQRAPSSFIPERQTALKTQIPTQKTTLHSLLFAAIPEVQPLLQITCACSAPKYRPWTNSPRDSLNLVGESQGDSYRLLGRNSPSIRRETAGR